MQLDAAGSPVVTHFPRNLCKLMVTDTVPLAGSGQGVSTSISARFYLALSSHAFSPIHQMGILHPGILDTLQVKH